MADQDREIAAELTREGQAMAHLPECLLTTCVEPCACCVCICDRLRQAEQRVMGEDWPDHSGYATGYAKGLRDARDAVRHDKVFTLWSREDGSVWIPIMEALAAIDALRGDQ